MLAKWHYRQWGDLTGASNEDNYRDLLLKHTFSQSLPITLLSLNNGILLGSVNVVKLDLEIRPELTPWIAQLYVSEEQRGKGIGTALVETAVDRSSELGFDTLYLYTSGTLPSYYQSIGWTTRETLHFKEKDRTVMEFKVAVNKDRNL
ncbi:MAG: GNAT family N-acetyltransferase [Desulfatitalea sp.]|nr:GNAT family N-acetyltransferase [Desulfatitalea sp.]NNK01363.1 GNAT family N-acetyltransferase [Desulfatitalea sp.]